MLTARRRALDVGRSAASRTLLGAEGVEGTGGAVGFEDDTVARLGIEQAVAALPARQAEAVRLRYLDGLSEADVATRMGLSVGAVKSHLRRGRLALERSWPAPGGAAIGPWDIPPGEDGALAP